MKRRVAALTVVAVPEQAQMFNDTDSIMPEIAVRGQGWAQLRNPAEMLDFALAKN